MSALRTALRPASTPALGSARRGASRYFTTFDPVAQSYVDTFSLYPDTGNEFNVKVKLSTSSTSVRRAILALEDGGGSTPNILVIGLEGSFIKILSNGFTPGNGGIAVNDGKLHEVEVQVNASTGLINVFIDGVFDYSVTHSSPSNILTRYIPRIGVSSGLSATYFSGVIADVSVNGGDIFKVPINRYYTPQSNIVLDESGSGNNGTFVNVATGDSKYYQQRADGDFVDLQGNVLEVAY